VAGEAAAVDKPDKDAIHAEEKHEADKADAQPPAEAPQELKKLVERTKRVEEHTPQPASKEEVARLRKMGLKEYPVKGTHLMLVGLAEPGKEPATVAQRVEMAKRLNDVGPRLPKYVLHLVNEKRPESSTKAILDVAQTVFTSEELMAKKKAAEDKAAEKAAEGAGPKRRTKKVAAEPTSKTKQTTEKAAAKQKAKGNGKSNGDAAPKKRGGIGDLIRAQLLAKKSTEEVLAAVKKEFPDAKTSPASIAWYRSELRDQGKLPKS
jgi:hypothetical protein